MDENLAESANQQPSQSQPSQTLQRLEDEANRFLPQSTEEAIPSPLESLPQRLNQVADTLYLRSQDQRELSLLRWSNQHERRALKTAVKILSQSVAWMALRESLETKIALLTKKNNEVDETGESNKVLFTKTDLKKTELRVYSEMLNLPQAVMNQL